jgi:hypothetical protein
MNLHNPKPDDDGNYHGQCRRPLTPTVGVALVWPNTVSTFGCAEFKKPQSPNLS